MKLKKWRDELARKEQLAEKLRQEQRARERIFLSVMAQEDIRMTTGLEFLIRDCDRDWWMRVSNAHASGRCVASDLSAFGFW